MKKSKLKIESTQFVANWKPFPKIPNSTHFRPSKKSYRGFIAPLYIVFGFPKNQFFPSSALALSPTLPKVIRYSEVWWFRVFWYQNEEKAFQIFPTSPGKPRIWTSPDVLSRHNSRTVSPIELGFSLKIVLLRTDVQEVKSFWKSQKTFKIFLKKSKLKF